MRLDAFLLADAVSTPPDGKVYIHGGGVSRVNVSVVPFVLPNLALAASFLIEEEELRHEHEFAVAFFDPQGERLAISATAQTGLPNEIVPLAEGESRYLHLALNFPAVPFNKAGAHRVELSADGEVVHTATFAVVVIE